MTGGQDIKRGKLKRAKRGPHIERGRVYNQNRSAQYKREKKKAVRIPENHGQSSVTNLKTE